jgi:hypothetical protein
MFFKWELQTSIENFYALNDSKYHEDGLIEDGLIKGYGLIADLRLAIGNLRCKNIQI